MSDAVQITKPVSGVAPKSTRFVVVLGDKGGIGKSLLGQGIGDYFYAKDKKSMVVVDADTQNSDVARMFSANVQCAEVNLRNENGWMDLMDLVAEHAGKTILVNTPAGIGEHFQREMGKFSSFLKKQKTPVTIEVFWAMSLVHDCVVLLEDALGKYGMHFDKVTVACNLHYSSGDPEGYYLWNESPLRTKLEKAGGKTMYFPALNLRVVGKLFVPSKVMPFCEAVDASLGEAVGLTASEKARLELWIDELAEKLDKVFADPVASIKK